ncbi:hypothetical protein BDV98DRAFT_563998 [Pterulicium gracile]|uniref:Uncharacterized protein n=1 Tax=Pterulicium gracile TaxID=1884261 RepID=A0A5C3QY72_9AGAR|nr:hypothetical protein BDV98DRAFT_563998 [Pterula gracilis]
MDFIKKMTSGQGKQSTTDQPPTQGGFMTSVSDSMGGGQTGERNEDPLDKAVDYAQERMGGGPQTNESSMEQAKDERISDAIRSGYKNATGKDVPIADK